MKHIIVIGAGFSGLSAACYLAKEGYRVTIYEKNKTIGGRASQLRMSGFTFDTGPTFYWMPDVFRNFFADFGESPEDYYQLFRLDPGYEVYFASNKSIRVPAKYEDILQVFERYEPGSSVALQRYMNSAEINYRVAMDKVVFRPGKTPFELIMPDTVKRISQFLTTIKGTVHKEIKNPMLRQILEFPVLFLGARSADMPSFYRFMNYADMKLGTWHIQGGFYRLVESIGKLSKKHGVTINTGSTVEKIEIENGSVKGVWVNGEFCAADAVISGADYHHSETLLEPCYRNYADQYWKRRVMAPSAYLFFIAFDKKLQNISHHTLFFDTDFDKHADKIYRHPGWPDKPLFYASFPSQTDPSMAPEGKDCAVILIPLAPGLPDLNYMRIYYFDQIISRMEKITGQSLKENILFYKSYGIDDFTHDYHAYKGNAYGLSNTLMQTAFLKPKIRNKKVKNLYYTGQLTVPGPGVPTTLISGKIVATEVINSKI